MPETTQADTAELRDLRAWTQYYLECCENGFTRVRRGYLSSVQSALATPTGAGMETREADDLVGEDDGLFPTGTPQRLIQRLEHATAGDLFHCEADLEEAVEIAAEEMAAALALRPTPSPDSTLSPAQVAPIEETREAIFARWIGSRASEPSAHDAFEFGYAAAVVKAALATTPASAGEGELREAVEAALDAESQYDHNLPWSQFSDRVGAEPKRKRMRAILSAALGACSGTHLAEHSAVSAGLADVAGWLENEGRIKHARQVRAGIAALARPAAPAVVVPAEREKVAREAFLKKVASLNINIWTRDEIFAAAKELEDAILATRPTDPGGARGWVPKTDEQIVAEVNDLAAYILSRMGTGYIAPEGFKFYEAHKQNYRARNAWAQAVEIYERVTGTEVHDALLAVEPPAASTASSDAVGADHGVR